jgi:hypothetical protein
MIKKYAAQNLNSTDIDALMYAQQRIQQIIEEEKLVTQKNQTGIEKSTLWQCWSANPATTHDA